MENSQATKFPWLSTEEIGRLEEYTKWYTWYAKTQKQAELYQQVIEAKNQRSFNQQRENATNELYYKWVTSKDNYSSNSYKSNARLETLVNIVKNKYPVDTKADSKQVLEWIVKEAKARNVSLNSLNNYLKNWDDTFLYEMWYKEKKDTSESWTLKNIAQWVVDSLAWLTYSIDKYIATPVAAAIAKAVPWTDSGKVDVAKEEALKSIENKEVTDFWGNRDSLEYTLANEWTDILQLVSWEWWAWLLAKIPAISKVIKWVKSVDEFVKSVPAVWKITSFLARKWTQWAVDTAAYNTINAEDTTSEDLWVWAWLNTAISSFTRLPWKKAIQDYAKRLEVGWLVNRNVLEATNNYIKNYEWELLSNVKATWKWLLERSMVWDKDVLRWQLNKWADMWTQAKNEILSQTKTEVESPAAQKAIKQLLKKYESQWELWAEYVKWLEKIKDKNTFTAKELDNIKWLIDDSWLHIYSKWEETDKIAAKLWSDVRRDIKEQIEQIAEKEWLWDLKAINNEIQVAKALDEWIYWKQVSEEVSRIGNAWWPIAQWYSTALDTVTSTENATTFANKLAKWTWMEKKDIGKMLWKNGKFSEDLLRKIFKNDENAIMGFLNDYQSAIKALPDNRLSTKTSKKASEKWKWLDISNLLRKSLLVETYNEWK